VVLKIYETVFELLERLKLVFIEHVSQRGVGFLQKDGHLLLTLDFILLDDALLASCNVFSERDF
jgi:hypothetical protein